jgi:hypothetical protein
MSAHTNMVWWEKTVEYKFVLDCLPPVAAIAPLSGKEEAAFGDAVLRHGETYLLIEFKRRRANAISEHEKFDRARPLSTATASQRPVDRLQAALDQLKKLPQSEAHHLVFGDFREGQFVAAAIRYTDALNATAEDTVLDMKSTEKLTRQPRKDMLEYLVKLRELRGSDTVSGGSVVVGVCEGKSTVMSVDEFIGLDLQKELSLTHSVPQSTPRRGMSR